MARKASAATRSASRSPTTPWTADIRTVELGAGLIVYRAKQVENPRSTSEAMIGTTLDPAEVLAALRATKGVEPPTHIPLPNTGITVRLGPRKPAFGVGVISE